jgi:hypothetical protein
MAARETNYWFPLSQQNSTNACMHTYIHTYIQLSECQQKEKFSFQSFEIYGDLSSMHNTRNNDRKRRINF